MVSAMGGRRDDIAPGRAPLPPVPPRPAAARAAERPAVERAERPAAAPPAPDVPSSDGRRGWLVLGLVLAAAATAAVFFTENPLYLRVALLGVCWAFVVAAFLAGNRRTDQVAAAGREAELRHVYDLELEREVTARHEFEVELESRLRREAEDAMREELAQLRTELAALTEIRGELAGLSRLRTELAGLGELRTDLGRMRSELTEQLSGELLIERMVMRAQSVRGPVQSTPEPGDGRTLDGSPSWEQAPAGGWDVDRWEETRVVPAEPVEAAPRPIAAPRPVPPVPRRAPVRVDEESADRDRPPSPIERHRRRAAEPDDEWAAAAPAWSAEPSSRRDSPATSSSENAAGTGSSYDGPGYDEMLFGSSPGISSATPTTDESPSYEAPSYEAPAYESYDGSAYDASGYSSPADEPAPVAPPEPQGHARLEQILAQSGVEAPSGGRSRRRRYRDENGETAGDDVLARVLGRN
jgi:hypothetical protein